ncbi:hypothetical protein NMY22_g16888 [Coprinellus aureogranulatus]|nr:hypothetical protein NMY22_g16888 [Coprinellus aureogranulatus]
MRFRSTDVPETDIAPQAPCNHSLRPRIIVVALVYSISFVRSSIDGAVLPYLATLDHALGKKENGGQRGARAAPFDRP